MLFALTLWEGSAAGDDRRGGTAHDSAGVNEFNFMLVKNNQDVRKFKSYLWLSRLNILDTFTHKQQFSRLGSKDQMLRKCVDSVCIVRRYFARVICVEGTLCCLRRISFLLYFHQSFYTYLWCFINIYLYKCNKVE